MDTRKLKFTLPVAFMLGTILFMTSCQSNNKKKPAVVEKEPVVNVTIPSFDANLAYEYIKQQVDFGPRVPGTKAHLAAKELFVAELSKYCDEVEVQEFQATWQDVNKSTGYNIIARVNPSHKKRILLAAHWDSRFMADQDEDESKKDKAIDGADDGGSGVGVLLSLAKTLKEHPIDLGVDIVLFDLEDQGFSEGNRSDTWALGSQYWSNSVKNKYKPDFGILLDMVGAKNAVFNMEEVSLAYAPTETKQVWRIGRAMGYTQYFKNKRIPGVTDDHLFVNQIAKIPMLDIIHKTEKRGFGAHWHTHNDNIDIIDVNTLKAVGQVLCAVLYKHSGNSFYN